MYRPPSTPPRTIRRLACFLLLVLCLGHRADAANPPTQYAVILDAPQTQMVTITMRVAGLRGDHVDVMLPTWRPGRYTILDPAGAVREVRAMTDRNGPRPIRKTAKSTWRIDLEGATAITVSYRVYANEISSRTRHVDDTHAFLSASAVFMYVPERRAEPVKVRIEAPEEWKIATGLETFAGNPRVLIAPNYDVLVDSPLEIGLHDRLTFQVLDTPHEIVIWPPDVRHDAVRMIEDFTAIIENQHEIFGTLPYERYVFLIHAGAGGGGTEHLNSTIMQTSRAAIEGSIDNNKAYKRFLGLVAHEFFHTWNVKQLRPAGIHPYDYQNENYTTLLWVAEGTTSYFDDLSLVRCGRMTPKKYLDRIDDAINGLRTRPGAAVQSLSASSFDAWIKFNHSTPDDINSEVSFYSKGALVSLLLDMEVRRLSGGTVQLDDVMRAMYERFPLSGPGYHEQDLRDTLEEMTGTNFDDFFTHYVDGTAGLPFEEALQLVGLELYLKPRKTGSDDEADENDEGDEIERDADQADQEVSDRDASDSADGMPDETADESIDHAPVAVTDVVPSRAMIGLILRERNGRTTVQSVRADGPAYAAGVIAGDQLIALDDHRITAANLDDRLRAYTPGAVVTLHVMRRDVLRAYRITLASEPDAEWTLRKVKDPTDDQRDAYESWLGQEW